MDAVKDFTKKCEHKYKSECWLVEVGVKVVETRGARYEGHRDRALFACKRPLGRSAGTHMTLQLPAGN
jgi:hypothetical protein